VAVALVFDGRNPITIAGDYEEIDTLAVDRCRLAHRGGENLA
jgi:hypothetical protein